MLYRVGTQREILSLRSKLPEYVIRELLRCTITLDSEYGANRDYLKYGGYTLIAETTEDVQTIKNTIDYDSHPLEWAEAIGENGEYISALYLLNDDFSIVILLPSAIAPEAIWTEVEE